MTKSLQDSIKIIQEELKNIENTSKQEAIANNNLVEKVEQNYYFLRDNLLIWEIDFSIIYKLFKKRIISSKLGLDTYNSKVCKRRKLSIEQWNNLIDALGCKKIEDRSE